MTKSYEGIYYVTFYIWWCKKEITSNHEQYDYHIKLLKRFNKHSKNNNSGTFGWFCYYLTTYG